MKTIIPATALFAILPGSLMAATTLIDFGRNDNTTTSHNGLTYNNVDWGSAKNNATDTELLRDTSNNATGWSLTATEAGSGSGGSAGPGGDVPSSNPNDPTHYPVELKDYALSALQDGFFANEQQGTTSRILITITDLNPNALYDLQFWGSRASTSNVVTTWSLTQGSGATASNTFTHIMPNPATVASWTQIQPTMDGTIAIEASNGGAGTGSSARPIALNFGLIEELDVQGVPEPSSAALIGLAGFSLLLRRRN